MTAPTREQDRPMPENATTYLGDGAYAEFDGFGIQLTTENGISVTNRIYLEPEVYEALSLFVSRCRAEAKARRP